MDCKYVMFDEFLPVIFPGMLRESHAVLANKLCDNGMPTSAGFLRMGSDGKVTVYGRSISLRLDSDPKDSEIINKLLTGEY